MTHVVLLQSAPDVGSNDAPNEESNEDGSNEERGSPRCDFVAMVRQSTLILSPVPCPPSFRLRNGRTLTCAPLI